MHLASIFSEHRKVNLFEKQEIVNYLPARDYEEEHFVKNCIPSDSLK